MCDRDGEWLPEVAALSGLPSLDDDLFRRLETADSAAINSGVTSSMNAGVNNPSSNVSSTTTNTATASSSTNVSGLSFDRLRKVGRLLYKLGDLGQAVSINDRDPYEGDSRYLSPELMNGETSNLPASDIFALGMTLFELASSSPLPAEGDEYHALRQQPLPRSMMPQCSPELAALLSSMVQEDVNQRPTAIDILRLPLVARMVVDGGGLMNGCGSAGDSAFAASRVLAQHHAAAKAAGITASVNKYASPIAAGLLPGRLSNHNNHGVITSGYNGIGGGGVMEFNSLFSSSSSTNSSSLSSNGNRSSGIPPSPSVLALAEAAASMSHLLNLAKNAGATSTMSNTTSSAGGGGGGLYKTSLSTTTATFLSVATPLPSTTTSSLISSTLSSSSSTSTSTSEDSLAHMRRLESFLTMSGDKNSNGSSGGGVGNCVGNGNGSSLSIKKGEDRQRGLSTTSVVSLQSFNNSSNCSNTADTDMSLLDVSTTAITLPTLTATTSSSSLPLPPPSSSSVSLNTSMSTNNPLNVSIASHQQHNASIIDLVTPEPVVSTRSVVAAAAAAAGGGNGGIALAPLARPSIASWLQNNKESSSSGSNTSSPPFSMSALKDGPSTLPKGGVPGGSDQVHLSLSAAEFAAIQGVLAKISSFGASSPLSSSSSSSIGLSSAFGPSTTTSSFLPSFAFKRM
jgi:hypothetical protein